MKKFLLFLPLVLMALTGAMAAGPWSTIALKKASTTPSNPHPIPQIPGARPLASDSDADYFFLLEAGLSDDAILLTAGQVSLVWITIETLDGNVVYDQQEILGPDATEIPIEGWDAGIYLISIHVGADVYEGVFEL